jgi:hypothetical protein
LFVYMLLFFKPLCCPSVLFLGIVTYFFHVNAHIKSEVDSQICNAGQDLTQDSLPALDTLMLIEHFCMDSSFATLIIEQEPIFCFHRPLL